MQRFTTQITTQVKDPLAHNPDSYRRGRADAAIVFRRTDKTKMKRLFASLGIGLLWGFFALFMCMLGRLPAIPTLVVALGCGLLAFLAGRKSCGP